LTKYFVFGVSTLKIGLSLNFYMLVSVSPLRSKATEIAISGVNETKDDAWWRSMPSVELESESNIKDSSGTPKQLWTVVSLCLLFRSSYYVQQLRRCLDCSYYGSVLPNLIAWEKGWEQRIKQYLKCEPVSNVGKQLSNIFQSTYQPFSLCIDKLVATLCLECPVPIPGFLTVSVELPTSSPGNAVSNSNALNTGTPRFWKGSHNGSLGSDVSSLNKITFSAPSLEDFPICPYPLMVLLECFGPRVLIDIVCSVLSESRLLFHANDLALLPVICEGLRMLIYPLQWTHVYLPVVPMHLLNVVEAPVPYMLGTHSKWLKYVQVEYMDDMILVDCNTGAIDLGGSSSLRFPECEDRWLMSALKSLMLPNPSLDGFAELSFESLLKSRRTNNSTFLEDENKVLSLNEKIHLVFYDVLFHLLRYVPDCLFYLNPSCPVFNRPLFISDYASDEYREALDLITVTNCFHVLTESIHTPSLAFFYNNILRVTELERKLLEQSIASGTATSPVEPSPGGSGSGVNDGPTSAINSVATNRTPIRRTNSGGRSTGGAFSRNISVANIIYDKLVSVSTPTGSSMNGPGLSKSGGGGVSNFNLTRQYGVKNVEEFSDGLESTKSVIAESPKLIGLQHAGKGLMKHVSIMGLSDAKEGAHSRTGGGVNNLFSSGLPSQNEIAYSSKFPGWLLKSLNQSSITAPRKMDTVRELLQGRWNHYAPFLKVLDVDAQNCEEESSMNSHSSKSSYNLVLKTEYNINPATSNFDVAAARSHILSTPMAKSRQHILVSSTASSASRASMMATPKASSVLEESSRSTLVAVVTNVPSFYTGSHSAKLRNIKLSDAHVPELVPIVAESTPSYEDDHAQPGSVNSLSPLARIFQNPELEDEKAGFLCIGPEVNQCNLIVVSDTKEKLEETLPSFFNGECTIDNVAAKHVVNVVDEKGVLSLPPPIVIENDTKSDTCIEGLLLSTSDLSKPLIQFDQVNLAAAQLQVKRWSVLDIAVSVGVDCEVFAEQFHKRRTITSSKFIGNTQFAVRHRAVNVGIQRNRGNVLNTASTQATLVKLGKMENFQCDECITQFLQKVVTESSIDESWLDVALQRCVKALQTTSNRNCLLDMLKNAKQSDKNSREKVSNVYPLNAGAFEAFSKLFSSLLRICSNQEDYLCAFGLLEVGGLYFRFVNKDEECGEANIESDDDDILEFLSERTCQHPIYHNSQLWCEILKSRIPPQTLLSNAVAEPESKIRRKSVNVNAVISEVHALLYIMLELEVICLK
jgi:hypothetical protein